jgi:hypothetical protein
MKRNSLLVVVGAALVLTSALFAAEEENKIKLDGIKCPVSGQPAKEGTEVDYKKAKVFFCCNNCPKGFAKALDESTKRKEPFKFAAQANYQLVATGQAHQLEKCPFTAKPVNPAATVKVGETTVTFCCNNCKGKAAKATGKEQIALIFNDKHFANGYKVGKAEPKN